jgi:hypothetical protein
MNSSGGGDNSVVVPWMHNYAMWLCHMFYMDPNSTAGWGGFPPVMYVMLASFGIGVLLLLFAIWWMRCFWAVFALNVFFERSDQGKLPHGLRTYLGISVLKDQAREILRK